MIAESFMMGRDASKNFLSGGKDCGGSESARAHNLLDAGSGRDRREGPAAPRDADMGTQNANRRLYSDGLRRRTGRNVASRVATVCTCLAARRNKRRLQHQFLS